jgi:hypothetical protein
MPLIDIVVADDIEAEAVGQAVAPASTYFGIEVRHVDQVKLSKLSLILDGVPVATPAVVDVVRSFTLLHEGSEDGPWVYRFPDRLFTALATLAGSSRVPVSAAWAGIEEFKQDRWDEPTVSRFLDSLCGLAEKARTDGKGLLLRMAL